MVTVHFRKVQVICSCCALLFFLVGIALIISGVLILKVVLPNKESTLIVQDRNLGRMPDGSLNVLTQSWAYPRYISYTQYWIYNYTNPLEVQNRGNAPDMYEKGPYSYRVLRTNSIEGFSDDDTLVSYRPKYIYTFDKANSCNDCDQSDIFLVPDIVFFKTMNFFSSVEGVKQILCSMPTIGNLLCKATETEGIDSMIREIIENYTNYAAIAIKALDAGPFVYTTVDELLFRGYDDPLFTKVIDFALKVIARMSPLLGSQLPANISTPKIHINNNNATNGAIYTILTGINDYTRIGEVLSFYTNDNSSQNSEGSWLPRSWWSNLDLNQCPAEIGALARKINGTMGDLFMPAIKKTDRLYIYDKNICRSVSLRYTEETVVKGINGYRFIIPNDVFNLTMPENCGFCHQLQYDIFTKKKGDLCLPDGLLDISRCTTDNAPIVVSNPHFLGAAREVTRMFLRLKADPTIHQTTFDVEPRTGVLLNSNRRIQLNVMVNRIAHAKPYQMLLPASYPILWMNESTLIDDVSAHELIDQLNGPYRAIKIVCWAVGVGLGSLCVLISAAMCTFSICSFLVKKHSDEDTDGSINSDNSHSVFRMFSIESNMRQRNARRQRAPFSSGSFLF